MADDLGPILDAVKATVEGLAFTLNGSPVPVVKTKGPRHREGIDDDTLVTVCKSEKPERYSRYSFRKKRIDWFVEVNVYTPHTGPTAGLADYGAWRTALLDAFDKPPLGGTDVFDLRIEPKEFLARDDMADQWDVMSFEIQASVVRSN